MYIIYVQFVVREDKAKFVTSKRDTKYVQDLKPNLYLHFLTINRPTGNADSTSSYHSRDSQRKKYDALRK